MLIKGIKGELQKGKHSTFLVWHILLPIVAILLVWFYYVNRQVSAHGKGELYYTLLTIAFPVGIAWMTAMSVSWEENNHFQCLLGGSSRITSWFSKLLSRSE